MADEALTSLAALGSLSADDIFYVVDDPAISRTHHKVTAATILASLGGVGSCVTHTCGAVGWRASGGTIARTLVHEDAFQLTTAGNARGDYAIDLQQVQGAATDVAGGDYSAIFGGRDNSINAAAFYGEFCAIIGSYNDIEDDTDLCWINGSYNYLHGTLDGCYGLNVIGQNIDCDDVNYGSYFGLDHSANQAFGCMAFMEDNHLLHRVGAPTDYPTYCLAMGHNNTTIGDVYNTFQFGNENWIEETASGYTWMGFQFGYTCQIVDADMNFMMGEDCLSYQTGANDGYEFRFVFNGDTANDKFNPSLPGSGYNQDSWFCRDDLITTWNVAWTNSFEFKILTDSIWYFEAFIAVTELGAANSYAWRIEGLIENDGGTTTILNSVVTNVYRDIATKEWQVIADNVNDRLVFQFRDTAGPDANNTNVQMSMFTIEVGYS
jgi:hypothetical protein